MQPPNPNHKKCIQLKEAKLKAAQTAGVKAGTQRSQFDLSFESDLREISAEVRQQQLRQLKVNNQIAINRDYREVAMNASNLEEAIERIKNLAVQRAKTKRESRLIVEQIRNLKKDGKLKQLDIELKENGIQPTDELYWRVVGRLLGNGPLKLNDLKKLSFWK